MIGGALVGLAASFFLLAHGRICGISGLVGGLVRRAADAPRLNVAFVVGLAVGGLVLRLVHPASVEGSGTPSPWVAVPAGLLVGFGTQLGSGCTSGHGVCGIGRRSLRSIAATGTFVLAGLVTVFVVRHLLGGVA